MKSPMRCCASLANAVNSCTSDWPTIANAHAVLLRSYGLNSPTRRSAYPANEVNSMPDHYLLQQHAAPYAILASCRAPISPTAAAHTVCCTKGSRVSALLCSQHRSACLCFTSRLSDVHQADRCMASKCLSCAWCVLISSLMLPTFLIWLVSAASELPLGSPICSTS